MLVLLSYIASVAAMRAGDMAVVTPFRGTSLIIAMELRIVVYGRTPDHLTRPGGMVVVATGVFTLVGEKPRPRRAGVEQAALLGT